MHKTNPAPICKNSNTDPDDLLKDEMEQLESNARTLLESDVELRLAMTVEERVYAHEDALRLFNDMAGAGVEFHKSNKVS